MTKVNPVDYFNDSINSNYIAMPLNVIEKAQNDPRFLAKLISFASPVVEMARVLSLKHYTVSAIGAFGGYASPAAIKYSSLTDIIEPAEKLYKDLKAFDWSNITQTSVKDACKLITTAALVTGLAMSVFAYLVSIGAVVHSSMATFSLVQATLITSSTCYSYWQRKPLEPNKALLAIAENKKRGWEILEKAQKPNADLIILRREFEHCLLLERKHAQDIVKEAGQKGADLESLKRQFHACINNGKSFEENEKDGLLDLKNESLDFVRRASLSDAEWIDLSTLDLNSKDVKIRRELVDLEYQRAYNEVEKQYHGDADNMWKIPVYGVTLFHAFISPVKSTAIVVGMVFVNKMHNVKKAYHDATIRETYQKLKAFVNNNTAFEELNNSNEKYYEKFAGALPQVSLCAA